MEINLTSATFTLLNLNPLRDLQFAARDLSFSTLEVEAKTMIGRERFLLKEAREHLESENF